MITAGRRPRALGSTTTTAAQPAKRDWKTPSKQNNQSGRTAIIEARNVAARESMSSASKENSIEMMASGRVLKNTSHDKAARQGSSRVALAAKHVNTGSQISFGSPIRLSDRKRSASHLSESFLRASPKRTKHELPCDPQEDCSDGELTDEDEQQQRSIEREPTPTATIPARRFESRRKYSYPRPRISDMTELDYPAPTQLSPIADTGEDLLQDFDFSKPLRFAPPRTFPGFLEGVERNMKLTLDDFPDLDNDDEEGEDSLDTIGLKTPPSAYKLH